jgi:hypothetical protein
VRVRQMSATVAAAALIVGTGIVMTAPPAAAASVTADCTTGTDVTVTATPGELITITGVECDSDSGISGSTVVEAITYGPTVWEIRVNGSTTPGTYTGITMLGGAAPGDLDVGVTLNVVAATAPIPSWVQAYGRPGKDATCLPGWGPSWQQWAVASTGGWVCTRSIPSLG